jgi:hypothetical protein
MAEVRKKSSETSATSQLMHNARNQMQAKQKEFYSENLKGKPLRKPKRRWAVY